MNVLACLFVKGNPFLARFKAGLNNESNGRDPNRSYTSNKPATVPGTPTDKAPSLLKPLITFPLSSKYMSFVAANGAFSLKSKLP